MLKADNVTVHFKNGLFRKRTTALDGFHLSVEKGDIFALLGPNGAGKSTAMYCFLGLITPDKGRITILGKEPHAGTTLFNKVAYLPEEPHYHLYLTVEEAVMFYAALYTDNITRVQVDSAIEQVGLADAKKMRLDKCSKGMKQKVGVATCLLNKPDLVFLDEPTRGLDPIIVREFRDILLQMHKQGTTIIINSHVLSEIEMICNHVAILNKGRVVVQDRLKNLVKFDSDNYMVEFERTESYPEFIVDVKPAGNTLKGMVAVDHMDAFMQFIRETGTRLYECSLKRLSLEDVFFEVLKEKKGS